MAVAKLSRPSRAGGVPLTEFLLIPFGPVKVDRPVSGHDYTFTREHGRAAVEWFDRQARKLAMDYEHQTLAGLGARPEGLALAAGWIGKLEVRTGGLWAAQVEWTERARQLIAAGEYRYFSPVIYWVDENYSALTGLGPVALTNDPAMGDVMPLAASRGRQPMVATVLKARPLNGASDSTAGDELLEAIADLGRACSEREFEGLVRERAVELVGVVRSNFNDDDLVILSVLSNVGYRIQAGDSDEVIAGGLMTGELQETYTRQHGGSASILAAAWRRDFAASAQLQREFGDVGRYVAFRRAEAAGRVRVVGTRAIRQTPPARPSTAGASPGFDGALLRRVYETSPALQREFGELETFLAFKRHEAAGHVQIFRR